MVRNKNNRPGNFGGKRRIEGQEELNDHAALRPDGTTAPRPQEKMKNGSKET